MRDMKPAPAPPKNNKKRLDEALKYGGSRSAMGQSAANAAVAAGAMAPEAPIVAPPPAPVERSPLGKAIDHLKAQGERYKETDSDD